MRDEQIQSKLLGGGGGSISFDCFPGKPLVDTSGTGDSLRRSSRDDVISTLAILPHVGLPRSNLRNYVATVVPAHLLRPGRGNICPSLRLGDLGVNISLTKSLKVALPIYSEFTSLRFTGSKCARLFPSVFWIKLVL